MCNREGGWIQPTLDQILALFSTLFDLSHLSFLHLLRRLGRTPYVFICGLMALVYLKVPVLLLAYCENSVNTS